jgi:hypothetical protein
MAKTKLPRGAKTAFIKAHGNLSAKEVVEAGAKEGIKLTPTAVYNIRSAAKKSKGKKRATGPKAKGKRRAMGTEVTNGHLFAVVEFVRVHGGIEKARQAIQTLESLQLN